MPHPAEFRLRPLRTSVTAALCAAGMFALGTNAAAQDIRRTTADPAPTMTEVSAPGTRAPIMQADPFVPEPAFLGVFADGIPAGAQDLVMAPFDTDPYVLEDAIIDDAPGMPMRIGIGRTLPGGAVINAAHDGQWQITPEGMRVWSFSVHVPGASAIRIHMPQLHLPEGSQILVNGANDIIDVYNDLSESGLWTMAVPGETVRIQYQASMEIAELPVITIDGLSHIYRVLDIQPMFDPTTGGLLPCHEDVMCHSPDTIARDSVATMDYVIGGNTFICSGGLLNDLDDNTFRGLILTANHCISSNAVANTATIYWFYQRNGCNGPIPNIFSLPRSNGAALLATSDNTDFTLMRTLNDPNNGQGFAAWSTGSPANGAAVTGIHHPGGSWKRISFGTTNTAGPICGGLPTFRYYYLKWNLGASESGSSGSPLFNSNWQVIGQLFGTCGAYGGCNQANHNNVYGRFNVTWSSISSIMTFITPDDEYEPNDSLEEAAPILPGTHDLILVDFDDWFAVEVTEPSIMTVTASKAVPTSMATRLFLRRDTGIAIDGVLINAAVQSVSAPVHEVGTYMIQYQKLAGWGGDYTLDILLEPDCNENGIPDHIDIANGTSQDKNGNGIPDECEDLGNDCPADLDNNGVVDLGDLLALLAEWGPCPGCPADLDDNGVVDLGDLLALLAEWGPCD